MRQGLRQGTGDVDVTPTTPTAASGYSPPARTSRSASLSAQPDSDRPLGVLLGDDDRGNAGIRRLDPDRSGPVRIDAAPAQPVEDLCPVGLAQQREVLPEHPTRRQQTTHLLTFPPFFAERDQGDKKACCVVAPVTGSASGCDPHT